MAQYKAGDTVWLMNPRAVRQKLAVGRIIGFPGKHKFHFMDIPESWFKVDVLEILHLGVQLMFGNDNNDQVNIEDAKGSSTIRDQKYIKMCTGPIA